MARNLHSFGDILNVTELAEYMGISKQTFYRLTISGDLPCVQVGLTRI